MRSLSDKPGRVWTAWRSPGRFTKNPDVIALPDGRLLAVYADTDKHWAEGLIRLTLIHSADRGRTWEHAGVIVESDRSRREPHWVTPRLSLLSDGRLAVMCDLDDYEHCHEWQPSGIWLWWSEDLGRTWSEPVNTGILGIEPDRIIELPDGRLGVGAHMICADTQKHAECFWRSADGGKTWGPHVIVAKDAVHMYCEGGYAVLADGSLVSVMRDNLHNNYPSQVSYSFDNGDTWTAPVEAPFAGDRPYIGELEDGRLLVTYRNQGGTRGTHAWLGHLQHELGYRVSGQHKGPAEVRLDESESALCIRHTSAATTQFNLLPPESYLSEVLFEARVRVKGSPGGAPDERCGFVQIAHMNVKLSIAPDGLYLGEPDHMHQAIDRSWPADMTRWRTLRVHHKGGLLRVYLDGEDVLRFRHLTHGPFVPTCFGSAPGGTGSVYWRWAKYLTRNRTEPEHVWLWSANSGQYPDQYERDRMIELHPNTHERPDNGYSTWHRFEDGEILVLDYTNQGDPLGQSHIVACSLRVEDFAQHIAQDVAQDISGAGTRP